MSRSHRLRRRPYRVGYKGLQGAGDADEAKLAHDLGKRGIPRVAERSTRRVGLRHLPWLMRTVGRREPRRERLEVERQKVRKAPQSIAANTCCALSERATTICSGARRANAWGWLTAVWNLKGMDIGSGLQISQACV